MIASDALDVDDILGLHAYFGGALQGSTKTERLSERRRLPRSQKVDTRASHSCQHRLGHAAHQRFSRRDPAGGNGFDPVSLVCKVSEADGRPAVKLSDNYSKAMGPPVEIERYRRVFGTDGISNVPVIAWAMRRDVAG